MKGEKRRDVSAEILIVEDSPTQAQHLKHVLENHGYDAFVAQNGREALVLLGERKPSLVISDVVMPVMDGFELCRKIKADKTLAGIPVVLLTALSEPRDVIEALASGADNFLTKPYSEQSLIDRVHHIFTGGEMRKGRVTDVTLEISISGKTYRIASDRFQILDFLLSSYESAIEKYNQLVQANGKLKATQDELKALNEELEQRVEARTERIQQLNRVIASVRGVNQLIVREPDPARLTKEVCDCLIDNGVFRSSLIALSDRDGRVAVTAEAGPGSSLSAVSRELESGRIPPCIRRALESSGTVVIEDPGSSCAECPVSEEHGGAGVLIAGLEHEQKAYGVILISAPREVIALADYQLMFDEVVGDLGFGLHALETERERAEVAHRLEVALDGTIRALGLTAETRDPYTAGHQLRVTKLACAIGQGMGLPDEKIEGIRAAGLMHDIGKMAVPAEILSKPARLTEAEFSLIKAHPQVAYEILKEIEFPWPIADMVLQHHERLDGSGYPRGLKGDEICLEARILAVADVVEAMSSHRPYRPALGIDKALEEVSTYTGSRYDQAVVDACLQVIGRGEFAFES